MNTGQRLAVAASALMLVAAPLAAVAVPVTPNSIFDVRLSDPLGGSNATRYSGSFIDSHQAEYTRFGPSSGVDFTQIARFEADLEKGLVRGFHSARTTSNVFGTTTSVTLHWGPTLLVESAGGPGGGPVPLELSVRLHGEFDTDDVAGLFSRVSQNFSARLMPVLLGATPDALSEWQTELKYEFSYVGNSRPTTFGHVRSAQVNEDSCPLCTAEVTGGDDAFAYGFDDLVLRTVLWVEPGDEIDLNFTLSGRTTVTAFGAYGDWSRTADFGFAFLGPDADRYALRSGSGASLAAWNAGSAVPEPSALVLAATAGLSLGMRRRSRTRAGSHVAASAPASTPQA